MQHTVLARALKFFARSVLIIATLSWFSFAILSGVESGIRGLLANLPNALPWLAMLAVVSVAFRRELAGGLLVMLMGVVSVFFFHAWTSPVVLFAVSLPITAAGAALIVCHYLEQRDRDT